MFGKKSSPHARREKFEELAYPHMEALYNTALRLARNPLDAEDLVQEAFLRAYRFYHQFEEGTNFKAWIFKILTNTFINHYRKKTRGPQQVELEKIQPYYPAPNDEGAGTITADDFSHYQDFFGDEINHALQQLSEDFRWVIILCDLEEFSYKEIATMLGIPIGTVMSRLSRARMQLQKLLQDYARQEGIIKKKT